MSMLIRLLFALALTTSAPAAQAEYANKQTFDRTFSHHTAKANGVRLHYVIGGSGDPVVLIHGWPQTWYEWHKIMPALAKRHTVIAVDYRGAGESEKTTGGYDKKTMATDIRSLVRQLGFKRANVVGHDIGMMVAYAYAAQYPAEVSRLVLMDAPLPGGMGWEQLAGDPRAWHFAFHSKRDVPEYLVAGKERYYLAEFFNGSLAYDRKAIGAADLDVYTRAYSSAGALRSGFELYRAFPQDAKDNKQLLRTKLPMPVLALGGAASAGEFVGQQARLISDHVEAAAIARSGHWIAEEQPDELARRLIAFLGAPLPARR